MSGENDGTDPLILTYHSISDGRPPLAMSPALFTEQMQWLAANARVVPLSTLVDSLARREAMPARTVVLTFDDALLDFHAHAAPVLRRLRLPAVIFVPTGVCGRTTEWDKQSLDQKRLMSWQQLRDISEQGFELGAHSISHPRLTEINPEVARREIVDSKAELESRLGIPAHFFCYPYGLWNETVLELVRSNYRAACSTMMGAVTAGVDLYLLPRVDAYYLRRPAVFRNLFSRRMKPYLGLRRMLRRVRGHGRAS